VNSSGDSEALTLKLLAEMVQNQNAVIAQMQKQINQLYQLVSKSQTPPAQQ